MGCGCGRALRQSPRAAPGLGPAENCLVFGTGEQLLGLTRRRALPPPRRAGPPRFPRCAAARPEEVSHGRKAPQRRAEGRPTWRQRPGALKMAARGGQDGGGRPPGYPLTERRGGDRAPEGEVRAEGGSRRLQAGPLLAGGAGGGGRRCGSAAGRRWPGCCSRCVCGRRCRAAAPQVRDEGRPEVPQRTAATAGGTAVGGRAEIRGFLFLNHLSLLNSHPPSLGLLPLDSKRPSARWVPVVQRT